MIGGTASITFGGPQGEKIEVSVVGAYPQGQEDFDLRTGQESERPEVLDNISNAALPESDPLFGEEGPLLQRWAG